MDGYERIEFKLMTEPFSRWEDIPVLATSDKIATQAGANEEAWCLSFLFGQEVRWNYEDSAQGHYIWAKYITREDLED